MGNGNKHGGSNQDYPIYDTNGTIDYRGSWTLNSFTTPANNNLQTSHSTADNTSSISVSFYGSQIQVLGMMTPGQGDLCANYSIDGAQPQTRRIPVLLQESPLCYQMLFVSPILRMDTHNFTIDVLETGVDRNYTFQMFSVKTDGGSDEKFQNMSSDDDKGKDSDHDRHHGTDAAAIVGGVLGSVIFLLLAFLVSFYFWRKNRLARMAGSGQQRLPPMMYYARPISNGTQGEKGLYTLEPASVIDTDSKFTFAVRRDALDEQRESWVSVNLPPSVPDTALVNGRSISDWSSYKRSSVNVQHSHPDVSRFSPYTSMMVLTPMDFRDRIASPLPSGIAGAPSQIETQTSSSLSLRQHERRLI